MISTALSGIVSTGERKCVKCGEHLENSHAHVVYLPLSIQGAYICDQCRPLVGSCYCCGPTPQDYLRKRSAG